MGGPEDRPYKTRSTGDISQIKVFEIKPYVSHIDVDIWYTVPAIHLEKTLSHDEKFT